MIIVTAGPNLFNKGVISELQDKGLYNVRIPSSKQLPLNQIEILSEDANENLEYTVDFPGGKIRLNNPINYEVYEGDILKINKSGSIYEFDGKLAMYPEIPFKLEAGEILIVGDGESAFLVLDDDEFELTVKVLRDATFGPRRGITPQNKKLNYEILTDNDYKNLDCLMDPSVTGIMLSFVEDTDEILKIREYISQKYKRKIKIFSKIETEKGINMSHEISQVSDYIVLARGDLLITTGEKKFPYLQEKFLQNMKEASHKVVIATELAHSLGSSYLMSRAELTFLHQIVSFGYKHLMLASETTVLCDPVNVYEKVSDLVSYYSDEL